VGPTFTRRIPARRCKPAPGPDQVTTLTKHQLHGINQLDRRSAPVGWQTKGPGRHPQLRHVLPDSSLPQETFVRASGSLRGPVIDGLTSPRNRHGSRGRFLGLPGVCSRVAMRSRCSGVSGGNESTTVRTCSVSTVAARSRVSGSVMLDLGESVASVSGVVAVGCACSALFCVLVVPSRCFEWFGFSVRYVFLSSGITMRRSGGFPACLGLTSVSGRGIREPVDQPISWRVLLCGGQFRWLLLGRRLHGCRL
jgi:hypothetical protein